MSTGKLFRNVQSTVNELVSPIGGRAEIVHKRPGHAVINVRVGDWHGKVTMSSSPTDEDNCTNMVRQSVRRLLRAAGFQL